MDKVLILNPSDHVAITFWLISMAMVAATAFFFLERDRVAGKWKTSLTVAGLVTGIAAWHYFYMRGVWVATGDSPTVLRYIDWLITVPLQIVEFYLILAAVTTVAAGLFWRLLIASIVMLVFGYVGETGALNVTLAFVIGLAAWLYIVDAGALNLIYNVADFVNKIAFGMAIYVAAISDSN